MHTATTLNKMPVRYSALLAAALLALCHLSAVAQVPIQQAMQAIDPPGRVARLNLVEGAVSFAPAPSGDDNDNTAWTQAPLNRPLTGGDRLWTDQRARAELHVGSTTVRMSAQTSLDFLTLDDNTTQLRLAQGTAKLRVRKLYPGQRLEVDTPNLAFVISQPGDYRLDVNPATNTTRVVSQTGAGVIYGNSAAPVNLGNQQQMSFSATDLAPAGPGATSFDDFDNWAMARDQTEDRSVTARYVPRETVGYQQLDSYGDWSQDPNYGAVWLPRAVPVNWAPYRVGHWSWIRPWGWTWIDDAPWGFAPFHYGRWAQIGPRWGWVPGQLAARPVYAPALVAFVGGGSGGVSWDVSIDGGARPALGWFPLAPGEAFRPAYRASPRYVTQVNQNIVVNNIVTQTNVTNLYRYARTPAAVTAVSAADFARGRPVANNAALTTADLGRAQVLDPGRGMPHRPEGHDMRPAASALPPAAGYSRPAANVQSVVATRPLSAAPVQTGATLAAPASTATAAQDRNAEDAQRRARFDLERQQGATRPSATNAQPTGESLGQRASREQAQRNAAPAQATARPDTRIAPDRNADNSIEQARRAQQQLQRDQQRQQRELVHQQNEQRRRNEDSLGQRAQREQAMARQQQAKEQADAIRRVQDQKVGQQPAQPPQQSQQSKQPQERQKQPAEVATRQPVQQQGRGPDQRDAGKTPPSRDQKQAQPVPRRDVP